MQATTGTLSGTPGRIGVQAILVIAVALAGVAFGRWMIPADSSSGSASGVSGATETSAAATIAQHKYESGNLDEVLFGETVVPAISVPNSSVAASTIAEHKFNSGALEEVLFGETAATLGAETRPETIPPAATIAQRKYDSGTLDEILFGTN